MISEFPSQEPTTGQWKAELLKIQSDIARDRPAEAPAVADEAPRRRSGRGTKLVLALVAAAIIVALIFGLAAVYFGDAFWRSLKHWLWF